MIPRTLAIALALQVHLVLSLQGGRGGAKLQELLSHTISASAHTRSLEPQDGLAAPAPAGIQLDSLGNAVSFFQTSSNSSSNTTQVSAQNHRRLMRSANVASASTKATSKALDGQQGQSDGDRSSPALQKQSEQTDEHSLTKLRSEVQPAASQSQTSTETSEQILSLPSIASSTLLDESNLLTEKLLERDTQTRAAPTIATYSSSDCVLGSKVAEVVVFPGKADAAGCMPGTSSSPDPLAKAKDSNGVPVVAPWPQNPSSIKFECEGMSASIVMHKATGGPSESCDEVLGRTVISESWAVKAKEGKCVPAVDQNSGATQYVQMYSFADASVLPQCFNPPSVASVLRSESSSAMLVGILCAAGILCASLIFVFIILPRMQSSMHLEFLPAPVLEPTPVIEEASPPEAVVIEEPSLPETPQPLLEEPSGSSRAATSTDPAPAPQEEHVPAQPRSKSFRNLKSYTDKSYADKRKSVKNNSGKTLYLPDTDQEGPGAQRGSTAETEDSYVPEESWL